MNNDRLRKELLRFLDDLLAQEGSIDINSKKIAKDFNHATGLDIDSQEVNRAVKYITGKGYLNYRDTSGFDKEKGTKDFAIFNITAKGRDFMEGKESGKGGVSINIDGDVKGEMVGIGQNISQEKIIEVKTIKNAIDDIDKLSQQERSDLKERVVDLEEEMQKENPDKTTIGNILKQVKDKGSNLLIGLVSSYLFQQFIIGIT